MLRISQEFYHMNRVLESCETLEQLQNADSWVGNILNNWDFIFGGMPSWKYKRRYKDAIVSIVSILEEKSTSMLNMLQSKYEQYEIEKEQRYKIPAIIKGFVPAKNRYNS